MKIADICQHEWNTESEAFYVDLDYHHDGEIPVPYIKISDRNHCTFAIELFRGFDISCFQLGNVTVSYTAPCGVRHPGAFGYVSGSFQKNMFYGLLTTCGLENTGPDSFSGKIDERVFQHGSLNYTIVDEFDLSIQGDSIQLKAIIKGKHPLSRNLVLERTVCYSSAKRLLKVRDSVTNKGSDTEQICLMYHYNFGFPFLSPDCKLSVPYRTVTPKNGYAETRLDDLLTVFPPSNQEQPHVFYLEFPAEEYHRIILENNKIGLKVSVTSKSDTLPYVDLWKCFQKERYVLAVEPCNAFPIGRYLQQEKNTAEFISGGETINYCTEILFEEL